MKHVALVLIAATLLIACGSLTPATPSTPLTDATLVKAQVARLDSPTVTDAQVTELVQGNTTFALDLYKTVTKHNNTNLIYSPYSISLAFSMVYAGAQRETEAQMAHVLHFLPQTMQHQTFNALDQHIANLPRQVGQGVKGETFQFHNVNAVWGQQGFPFEQDYLNILAQQYGAGLHTVDFVQNPGESRELINTWVAQRTNNRIKDLMPVETITPQTRLVLVNAIYFKASWLFPFDTSSTRNGAFTLLDGSEVRVPLMKQHTVRAPYLETDTYQAIQVPYLGQTVDMLMVLPKQGHFESIEDQLNTTLFNTIREGAQERDVTLTMPRFDVKTSLDLEPLLQDMGMSNPFTASADFSKIANDQGLFISAAVHQGTITVDEHGTEATAATGIAMNASGMQRADMNLNHPFIFAIIERKTGTVLFLGRVVNPAQ